MNRASPSWGRPARAGQPISSTDRPSMRIFFLALAVAFGAVTCIHPTPSTQVEPAASASPSTENVLTAAVPRAIDSLPGPSKPICVLSAAEWSTAYPDLWVGLGSSGSPRFAYVRAGRARLTVGAGSEVLLELETPRIVLRGYPETTQFIYTKRAVVFGGWLVPLPTSPLTLSSAGVDGRLEPTAPTPPHVRAMAKHGETAVVRCADLTIVPESFDPDAVLPSARAIREGHLLDQEVLLSLEPGGAPVAILACGGECPPARVVEERGAQVKIVWNDDDHALVFGWIEQSALASKPLAPRPAKVSVQQESSPPEPRHLSGEVLKCAFPVPLVEGGRYGAKSFPIYQVGIIQPETPVRVVARDTTPGYASVELDDEPGIRFPEDALLLVPTADIAHCERAVRH